MEEAVKKDRSKKNGKKNSKPSVVEKIKDFWKGVKAEFRKVIWPTKEKLKKQTIAVTIFSAALGAFIKIYDLVCQYIISFIK